MKERKTADHCEISTKIYIRSAISFFFGAIVLGLTTLRKINKYHKIFSLYYFQKHTSVN